MTSFETTETSPIDVDRLANQSSYYDAIITFHGKDALDVLTYPIGSLFSKTCFMAVIQCLGTSEEFSEILPEFPLKDLFHVSLYLGSDTLLYFVVFDLLSAVTAVTLLDLAMKTLGERHHITVSIIYFIIMITDECKITILRLLSEKKASLRNLIRNSCNKSVRFVRESRKPLKCLCCRNPITGYHERDLFKRLAPMACCGMLFHLSCQLKLLRSEKWRTCPSCSSRFYDGEFDEDSRDLHSVMNIRQLKIYGRFPIPYRVRPEVWIEVRKIYNTTIQEHSSDYHGNI